MSALDEFLQTKKGSQRFEKQARVGERKIFAYGLSPAYAGSVVRWSTTPASASLTLGARCCRSLRELRLRSVTWHLLGLLAPGLKAFDDLDVALDDATRVDQIGVGRGHVIKTEILDPYERFRFVLIYFLLPKPLRLILIKYRSAIR